MTTLFRTFGARSTNILTRVAACVVCVVGAMILLVTSPHSKADDWPKWMGPKADGVWREDGIVDELPAGGPKVRWRKPIGPGYSGPSVAGGLLYVMDRIDETGKGQEVENNIRQSGDLPGRERVQCLDIRTGETKWSYDYDCPYRIAYPTGPRCTPTVDGDRVYTLGAMGDLHCFDRTSGKLLWHVSLRDRYGTKPPIWGYASHPMIDGDQLLVPAGGEGSGVVSLDKMTGKEHWKAVTTKDIAYAPLVMFEAADKRQLLFWHADGITSLDPTNGKQWWFVQFPEQPNPSNTSIATPQVVGNYVYISEFYTGSLLLQVESDPPAAKEIRRSHRTDPRSKESINALMVTPIIRDGHVFGIGHDSRGRGVLRCVELESGKLKWQRDDWLSKTPLMFATAFFVQNGDRYFAFADTGELLIVEMNPSGYKVVSRAKLLEPTGAARGRRVVWSHPAFADGHMFARNDKEIIAVDLRSDAN